jgi:addiction module RelE/StbE family toxin
MYKIEYLESVIHEDIPHLSKSDSSRIKKAIEEKLVNDPVRFGKPLQYSLKGCRRLRVGNYRIIYVVEQETVLIVKIGHRKEVYK